MIYATIAPEIPLQFESITRRFGAVLAGLAVLAASVQAAQEWREAPDHLAVFAPAPQRAAYRAAVSPLGLDAVLQALVADPALVHAAGAWTPRARLPVDAFGRTGGYDRWTLMRLYGSRQPLVARGTRTAGGGVVESWTLVSPYPSADLTRLEPGTLLIVLRIAQ
jgi:hypothetical protein